MRQWHSELLGRTTITNLRVRRIQLHEVSRGCPLLQAGGLGVVEKVGRLFGGEEGELHLFQGTVDVVG